MWCSICSVGDLFLFVFFFKQKTAYEMRISDWSSDVCSSDLVLALGRLLAQEHAHEASLKMCGSSDGRQLGGARRCRQQGSRLMQTPLCDRQIGRASCRERVCQYV